MKTSKRVISLVLTAIMVLTTFAIAAPMFEVEAADITIGGVSQTRVVGADGSYAATYDNYAANYLNGASRPTNIVVPGLNATYTDGTTDQDDPGDYVIQGMSYYPEKDWMLVTAYHSDGNASSKVFALDAATGDFVALFDFKNVDGSVNYDHGGGIAVSEHNLYYACGDKDQKIAYAPLSEFDVEVGTYKTVTLVDSINLYELGDSYTAYVCYDDGVLWAGNFYDKGTKVLGVSVAADYNSPANSEFNSMVFGYKLAGNSSAEEWDYLKGKFENLLTVTTASGTGTNSDSASTCTWTAYKNAGTVNVAGTITAPTTSVGEFTGSFGSFTLTEGVNYTIEFTSTNNKSDMYMFSPAGTHCNVKQSSQTTITQLEDGRYHYSMNFTAGLKPTGADSSWPTTQSTDGTYTGTYTVRFDQDAIQAGEAREFEMTNIKISQTNTYANKQEKVYDEGSAGSPTYAIALSNNIKDVQYAVVDNGKLYLSRSYGSGTGNSVTFGFGDSSTLTIADIDLSIPGSRTITVNTASGTKQINAYEIKFYTDYLMMPMSEGLCVVDDNIFITFEGASNKYLNESDGLTSIGNCATPVDVVWQLDPYKLMDMENPEPENSIYYEKVNSLSEIVDGEEYLIVHESTEKDPVTQTNILYALDANGGFKNHRISKSDITTVYGYNGMVGHAITEYSVEDDKLYLGNAEKDDIDSVRWTLEHVSGTNYKIKNNDSYFANCNSLFIDEDQITMAPANATYLDNVKFMDSGNGNGGFWLSNSDTFFLWCNDGLNADYNKKITSYYIQNGNTVAAYSGLEEQQGTFHCDALNLSGANILGASVPADNSYGDGVLYLYKRVKDNVASTYESRVYTDLSAELQEDGTYTIDLETYAISPNHYQYVGERPTDYIIVADTSTSMEGAGTGLNEYDSSTGGLDVHALCEDSVTAKPSGTGVVGYGFTREPIYMKHTDGKYYRVFLAVNNTEFKNYYVTFNITQKYWAYYVTDDGEYYVLKCDNYGGGMYDPMTSEEFFANVDAGTNDSGLSTNTDNGDGSSGRRSSVLWNSTHYRFTTTDYADRITTLKEITADLVDDIATQNAENRIALVQYGADASTGYYNTSGSFSQSTGSDAFWSVSNKDSLKTVISNLTTSAQTSTSGIEMDYANAIMTNSGVDYKADGDRNVAIIFVSDGMAGADGSTDATAITNAANNVIGKALTAKNNGAFVYTVLIGQDAVSGYNKKTYMEAVSTKYAAAASLSSLGGQSVDGIIYAHNLSSCSLENYIDFGAITTKAVGYNTAVGLANLDANSILREKLSDAFIVPADQIGFEAYFITGEFDEIGRFAFDEENKADASSELTIGWDASTPELVTVSGYDYSTEYIAQGKAGRKLQIRITGVLANPDADITNTSINDTATTAIYQSSSDMTNTGGDAFKYLPTEYFNIPEYTYVLDYGLPMYDSDVNGTLKSVSADLSRQRDANGNLDYKTISENGLVEITNNNLDLIYRSTPTNFADSGYCLIQRDDGTYDWFEIKVVPASNVLFEEAYAPDKDGATGASWSTDGTTKIGTQTLTNEETDVYGYDSVYADSANGHSYGSAAKTTVSTSSKRSVTKTFDFVGDGIDLISACGDTTGIMIVKISGGDLTSPKAYIVDTYYGDSNVGNMVYQTPVVNFRGNHGTYTVEATAAYLSSAGAVTKSIITGSSLANGKLSATTGVPVNEAQAKETLAELGIDLGNADLEMVWFDDNSVLNGGTGAKGNVKTARDGSTVTSLDCYLDGFRVYNPLGSDSPAYKAAEKNATYINVIDALKNNQIGSGSTTIDTLAYAVGSLTGLSFADYQNVGPQNELYLKSGADDALVLMLGNVSDTSRVMLGLRAVTGTAVVTIGSGDKARSFDINSATEMYYDITDCIVVNDENIATITIQNSGSGILAVNNIKTTGEVTATSMVSEEALEYVAAAMAAPVQEAEVVNGVVTDVVEDDTTIPDTDDDTTTPDDGNDTTGDDTTTGGSFIEQLIAMIIELIKSIFTILPAGEVM